MSQMIAAANCFFWVAFRCNHIASSPWEPFWPKKKIFKKALKKYDEQKQEMTSKTIEEPKG